MTQPTVCAVMLTADRPAMAKRAVECFKRQTYPAKTLVVMDTGNGFESAKYESVKRWWCRDWHKGKTIGELRNLCNGYAAPSDILIHWDDDDYSHPSRIAEQVELLQSSGAEAVGYKNMLFWRTNDAPHAIYEEPDTWTGDQAWLYTNHDPRYCLGTSLCYWRKTWERRPFEALPKTKGGSGEDTQWLKGVRSVGETSLVISDELTGTADDGIASPRMIASIHGGNTQYYGADLLERSASWNRVHEWDRYCAGVMNL